MPPPGETETPPGQDACEGSHTPSRALVFGCFFFSGASALLYEIVWMRQLVLIVGATSLAVSTVLSIFMLGLAIGAAVFGPVADRSRSPLRLYGFCELGIGLYALGLPLLVSLATPGYVAAARLVGEGLAGLTLLRLGLAFALLLVPTLLMGGTLPLLMAAIFRGRSRLGRDLGMLYGINVAGAVFGCVATGFLLIPHLGVPGSTQLAAAVNLLIALAALLAARPAPANAPALPAPPEPSHAPPGRHRILLWLVLFLSGFFTMGYEVLWTRMLVFSLTSTVYAFSIILATFLAGLALGSALFAAFVDRRPDALLALAIVEILAGVLVLVCVPSGVGAHDLIRIVSDHLGAGAGTRVAAMVLAAGLMMLVPATVMGIVFPLACRQLIDGPDRSGGPLGLAYTLNTAGSVIGSLATGLALIPLFTLKGSVLLLASLQFALGVTLLTFSGATRPRRAILLLASSGAFLLGLAFYRARLTGPNPFDTLRSTTSGAAATVLAHEDGIAGSVTVVGHEGGARTIRIDGFEAAGDAGGGYGYMAMMSHIPMLLHPAPRRQLVICFGTGTTAGSGLLHPGTRLDVVDINATVLSFAHHFRGVNGNVAKDPRTHLIVDDGRNYMMITRERYDVITSEPMPPIYAGVVSLYSREYYELARDRLEPGGLIAQWLPFHLLRWEESCDILRTVLDVFPETTLWIHGTQGIIVARKDRPISIDPEDIRRRITADPAAPAMRALGIRDVPDFVDRFALGPAAIERLTALADPITDERPSLEFHTLRSSHVSMFGSRHRNEALALEKIYRLRLTEPLPVKSASAVELSNLEEFYRISTHDMLAHLYLDGKLPDQARRELEEGLRRSRSPAHREHFERDLADLAR